MTFPKQSKAFRTDGYTFFQTIPGQISKDSMEMVERLANEKDFKTLSENQMLIEQKFLHLYQVLSTDKARRDEFWLLCYYYCLMLENYYIAYDQPAKVEQYQKLRHQIWLELEKRRGIIHPEEPSPSFIAELGKQLKDGVSDLAGCAIHTSKLRNHIALYNVYRIYWIFCRLTLTHSLRHIAQNTNWLEQLSQLLSRPVDSEHIIKQLETFGEVFRGLSVGFFAARFLINAAMVLKHTIAPSLDEEDEVKGLKAWARFKKEMSKRHVEFLNDITWGVVNGVTNYADFFHLSAAAAGWITAGFLVFDVALMLWRHHLAKQDYLLKKAEYEADLKHYKQLLDEAIKSHDEQKIALLQAQCDLTEELQKELEIKWQATSATLYFNTSAALLLAAGFSASMIVGSPVLIPVAYAACTIAVAMYLSASAYNEYKEKELRFTQAQVSNASSEDIAKARKEYEAARNEFIFTMVKNIVLPSLMVATFAICWEAALVLAAVYLTYEVWRAYQKHAEKQAQAQLPQQSDEQKPILKDGNTEGNDSDYDDEETEEQYEGGYSPIACFG
ncbi:coiled-coil protein [Legionella beliardensis]|uniref:Coiled-coil protein n=1 Tax=Legionella beliardensis TaxID=91822 RepID=A0A378I5V7_9GAMM|nr:hypothetical protein [Legionella beliardensis]STX30242.1 coiled-coil protein [Legionella beliardensis]